ncbi:MAG TPA: zinc metallopeptidase [Chloroflexia bacterium]|nr:zinc metallopeptidase [Chloroflexia bacterium]
MFFFDFRYIIFVMLPAMALMMLASWWVKSAFKKASEIPNMQRITGAQAARRILDSAGLYNVPVEPTQPHGRSLMSGSSPDLDDHYDPTQKVLRLSPAVYSGASVAAIGVAAHEAGHAVQDAQGYAPMRARTALVPAANLGSNFGWILIILGIVLGATGLAWLGVAAFALGTLFALLTLPVELDASSRAMKLLTNTGMVDRTEYGQARAVLNAAAFTYVAGLAVSILNLLYYVMLVAGIGRSDD